MKRYTYNDTILTPGRSFTSERDGETYAHPANWASVWTDDDFAFWGVEVEELPEPEQPEPTPPEAPLEVSPRQARLALSRHGLLSAVEAAIIASGDEELRISWEYSTVVRRDDPGVIALATQLGIVEQLPALFEEAATL